MPSVVLQCQWKPLKFNWKCRSTDGTNSLHREDIYVDVSVLKTSSFTVATMWTHHGDAEAPYVRLDAVALLVEVWVDPLGLKDQQEGENDWRCSQRVTAATKWRWVRVVGLLQTRTLIFFHPLLAQGRSYTTSSGSSLTCWCRDECSHTGFSNWTAFHWSRKVPPKILCFSHNMLWLWD